MKEHNYKQKLMSYCKFEFNFKALIATVKLKMTRRIMKRAATAISRHRPG